jgi:hypothetical protein
MGFNNIIEGNWNLDVILHVLLTINILTPSKYDLDLADDLSDVVGVFLYH